MTIQDKIIACQRIAFAGAFFHAVERLLYAVGKRDGRSKSLFEKDLRAAAGRKRKKVLMYGNNERGRGGIDDFGAFFHVAFFIALCRRAVKPRFAQARLHDEEARVLEFFLQITGDRKVDIAFLRARDLARNAAVDRSEERRVGKECL